MMQVKFDAIPDTGLVVDAALPVDFIDSALPPAQDLHGEKPGHTKLRLTRHDDNVLIDGTAEAHITGECALCVKPLHQTLKTKVGIMLFPAGANKAEEPSEDEVEVSADDDGAGEYHNKMIDWGDVVRQHLLLAMPIAPRCKDDCKGLCPVCGIDRNTETCTCETKQIDPRWEKLKQIKLEN